MIRRILPYFVIALISMALTTMFKPLEHLGALAQSIGRPQPRCATFPETGKTVCGRFLEYWRENGNLSQQGYPISEPFVEVSDLDGKPYTVQYFERSVFELHPEEKPPYDVLLSQLGTFRLRDEYPNGVPTPAAAQPGAISGRLGFPSEVIPPQKVYAIEVVGPKVYSVTTTLNQQTFTIDGVAPGTYYVVAYLADDPFRAGAYSQFVLCGLSANCTDHQLVPVTVRAGETTRDVRVEDWYVPGGSFPPQPDAPQNPLVYMWPTQIPQGLRINKATSEADADHFVLELEGGQGLTTIAGGRGTLAERVPARGTPTTVRGVQAILFTTGAGFSLFWTERGQPYVVGGAGQSRDAVLAMAESLEALDLATWQSRLQNAR